MKSTTIVSLILNCSLERAFKTPMLCDTTKILDGYGPIAAISGMKDDETWGQEGGTRIPLTNGNFWAKKGEVALDTIYVRKENEYWHWGLTEIKSGALFFTKRVDGEMWFDEFEPGKIKLVWKYTYYSKNLLTQPICWMFTKIFWRGQMKKAIRNMKRLAENEEPFVY